MEYIVSARKYRPATFRSVVGQGNITTTLKNAIKSNHLAHAYLFCGSRGVGKTTCARIFAKTINCSNISDDFEACNACESCQSFNDNRSYNIHELDAASNNSVDDIRSLIDKVRVPPQLGSYSVYIIDEVHMLSQAAFNAFLKTLEEPPRHAIFILATTEKHKILPTILSRCQIFDFNRITIADAVGHLKYVSESEGVQVEEEGLAIIAQKADGAMRDALSIFDQIVAFSGKQISYQQVIDNLNVLDYDYYFRLTDAFLAEDYKQGLLTFNEILLKGFDAQHFMAGLNSHMRDLLMCRDASTAGLLEVGQTTKEKYVQQAANCSVDFLYEALKIINDSEQQYRAAKNKRLHIEFALIRLARIVTEKKKVEPSDEIPIITVGKVQPVPQSTSSPRQTTGSKSAARPIPPPPGMNGGSAAGIKSVSLKNLAQKVQQPVAAKTSDKEEVKEEAPIDPTWNESFDQEKLNEVWRKFTRQYDSQPRIHTIYKNHPPQLLQANTLLIKLRNNTQEHELNKERSTILSYLRRHLKNAGISLNLEISQEEDKTAQKAFTVADKYKAMADKNPALAMFRKQFNLDLE